MMSLDDDELLQVPPLPDNDPIGHGTSEQALDFEHRKIQAMKRLSDENVLREMGSNNVIRAGNLEREIKMLGQMTGIACEGQISTGNLGIDVGRP